MNEDPKPLTDSEKLDDLEKQVTAMSKSLDDLTSRFARIEMRLTGAALVGVGAASLLTRLLEGTL